MLEMSRRLQQMYQALHEGDDMAPSMLLRVEGLMEAAVLTKIADQQSLDDLLDQCHYSVCQRTLAQDYGADWRRFYPFPQIPFMAQRAPVYPSSKSAG